VASITFLLLTPYPYYNLITFFCDAATSNVFDTREPSTVPSLLDEAIKEARDSGRTGFQAIVAAAVLGRQKARYRHIGENKFSKETRLWRPGDVTRYWPLSFRY
jgi:hypothetical protein